ncbi:MAG: MotA/TolQ/ExbB proton channel family protein [Woeseiaceae bacterium]|nr:MotA/TolQ/ExbB proton channel family protein [Woeseiaceae bacterium]
MSGAVRFARLAVLFVALGVAMPAAAQSNVQTLDELLKSVRDSAAETQQLNREREQAFRAQRDRQRAILQQTQAEVRREEARSEQLKAQFDRNEQQLEELNETLRIRVGDMGELFGVVRQVAGDAKGTVETSLVTAQLPGRSDVAIRLAQSTALPSIADLQALQALLLEEMIEAGRIVRFDGEIETAAGLATNSEVVRAGVFNVVNDSGYLIHDVDTNRLRELERQPAGRYTNTAIDFFWTDSGYAPLAVDPSRGSLLGLVVRTPGLLEQIRFGGFVGYVIIALAVAGIGIALLRLVSLQLTAGKISRQLKSDTARTDNPLGRVLAVYEQNRTLPAETLDLKLDEAVMRELPALERFHSTIKVLAGIAPLMGLLGTVVGMIRTFQSITLFGTGDPKLMADGISQALVTTVEGLVAAIPLVFLHTLLTAKSSTLIDILETQTAGLIARRAEQAAR